MFAFKAKVPVVPMIIEKKAHVFRRTKMLVGKPISFEEYYDCRFNSELNDQLNEKVRCALLETQADLRSMLNKKKDGSN